MLRASTLTRRETPYRHELTKRYGETLALDRLDLASSRVRSTATSGPTAPARRRRSACCSGCTVRAPARRAVRRRRLARPGRRPPRVAYVAGEPSLWPALTGAETFEFLARLHGGTDVAYRDQLVDRFQLDTLKKIRALSKGNRQKVQLDRGARDPRRSAAARRADGGLDPLMEVAFRDSVMEAKERGQTVFLSSHILSEVEALCDRVGILKQGRLVDEGTLADCATSSARLSR